MADVILEGGLIDVGDGDFRRADVTVEAGAEVVDCGRFAVVPGMVNAHCHSNTSSMRWPASPTSR
jgi:cytosine/adenosine deaminase-related metal-dependent hydrolase